MNKVIIYTIFLIFGFLFTYAQQSEKKINLIPLDKSALSGIGLEKIDLKDEPEKDFYQKKIYWGEDLGVFVVSTENWVNKVKNYSFDEFIYMYQGQAIVKPIMGPSQVFESGEYFFAPKGFNGEWEISAGNYLHYELSVISSTRVDSSKVVGNPNHKLFDKSMLSGNSIVLNNNGLYVETIQQGLELTVNLIGERLGERILSATTKEQLIQVLSGQITISNDNGDTYTFYTGDFFIIRKGLSGTWKNDGHGLVKYLSVEKTDNTLD